MANVNGICRSYDLPYEPYNRLIWCGSAMHEHHHISFKVSSSDSSRPTAAVSNTIVSQNSYQAYLPGLDWLLGTDKAFYKWNEERKRKMKEGTWFNVKYVQDVDGQEVKVEETPAGKKE